MKNAKLTILSILLASIIYGQEGPVTNSPGAEIVRSAEQNQGRIIPGSIILPRRPRHNFPPVKMPKELKEKLSITKFDKTAYQNYLENSKINIVKIWNNQCANLGKVVDVEKDKDCLAVSEYFSGSLYSFASKKYLGQGISSSLNAGVSLVSGNFRVINLYLPGQRIQSVMTQIMIDLGETGLEKIEKDSLEVKNFSALPLFNHQGIPVWKTRTANYEAQGVKIADDLPAKLNHTYLLRSVFYERYQINPGYQETVYAFQLVKFEDNIATVLWKKISSDWSRTLKKDL